MLEESKNIFEVVSLSKCDMYLNIYKIIQYWRMENIFYMCFNIFNT